MFAKMLIKVDCGLKKLLRDIRIAIIIRKFSLKISNTLNPFATNYCNKK